MEPLIYLLFHNDAISAGWNDLMYQNLFFLSQKRCHIQTSYCQQKGNWFGHAYKCMNSSRAFLSESKVKWVENVVISKIGIYIDQLIHDFLKYFTERTRIGLILAFNCLYLLKTGATLANLSFSGKMPQRKKNHWLGMIEVEQYELWGFLVRVLKYSMDQWISFCPFEIVWIQLHMK